MLGVYPRSLVAHAGGVGGGRGAGVRLVGAGSLIVSRPRLRLEAFFGGESTASMSSSLSSTEYILREACNFLHFDPRPF